jgi:mono/diheme cytochrome c family protein
MKRVVQLPVMLMGVSLSFFVCLSAALPARSMIPDTGWTQAKQAAALYQSKCATCHGKDGRARTFKARFNGARNLANASWQESVTDERIFNSISNGRGKMPAFGNKFSQTEIESLVAHVRALKK